ncbi:MAG: prephenate dehydrogenase/arogenate dehydrogenase family protein [Gammaproteobacteria bacterium]|nr:prephenate dehydrogenase/arogenate dehydrogenase family protein [Gammaproteobacteria bacterium]
MINKLAIIGTGLIGGSLARALKAQGAVAKVIGVGRNPQNLEKAMELGAIDAFTHDAGAAVVSADMVVLATPIGAMEDAFRQIAPALTPQAVVTDVGSVKAVVVAAARRHLGERLPRFVPGHPIAGTERSGVTASEKDLFQDRHVVLTPVAETEPQATALVRQMWEVTGSTVSEMTVAQHDHVLSATSHLPHVLAYTLVDHLAHREDSELLFRLAAGGFYDFTRIASSDPVMWRDICLGNREAITAAVRAYRDALDQMLDALDRGDGEQLSELFTHAKRARDRYIKQR